MANDIDKTSPHYKGDFGSIYEVNKKFPTGGVAGDFVVIEGWAHYWNADRATWCVNAERDSYWDELITNIIEKFKLFRGATYMGVASLDTVPAKAIGVKMYYFAIVAGTYKNFGDLAVPQGINVLYSENGSSWINSTLLEVAQELGVSTWKTVSQKALNDALALKANQSSVNEALAKKADKEEMNRLLETKANTSDVNTKFTEEKTRVDAELDKKFDKSSIAQETGEAEDKVMSQKAVSDKLSDLADNTEIRNEDGVTIKTPFREIESPEFLHCIVDAEDRFLFGIQLDGSIEWSKGVPAPIRAKLQEIISKCQQDKTEQLEAINSVKEELAALQEGKVDKEDGKSLIDDEVKECFRVIENEEFIMAVVDSEDRVLFGIYRATGKPYYPLNEMYHVEQNEEFFAVWLDEADHVLFGIRRDGQIIGEIHAVNALKQVISQLQSDVAALQEKVGTIDTNLKELLDVFSLQENPEYMAVETDAEGKILSATNPDGSHYIHNAKSETIPTEFSHIEDPEGRTEITTDAEGKVLGYRDSEGHRHESSMSIERKISLTEESAKSLLDTMKVNGEELRVGKDWSNESLVILPIPEIASIVNITSPDMHFSEYKTSDKKCTLEYLDKYGNYFKKSVLLNAQGSSSMGYEVKNQAIDITDGSEIKFGNWVAQDSFHLKKYYIDSFRGQCIVAYHLMEEVYQTRLFSERRPWSYTLNSATDKEGTSDMKSDFESGALGHPDGFPIIVYLNGVYQGIYTWNLKKHRDNYFCNKKKSSNIILDGVLSDDYFWKGNIDWTQFEIRNPKGLKDINGNDYNGDIPLELSDTDKLSKQVKSFIQHLASAKNNLKSNKTKEEFEKYFNVPMFIDYWVVSQYIYNFDGFAKNWIWCTWDGYHWCPTLYDTDSIWGMNFQGSGVYSRGLTEICSGGCTSILYELYKEEIEARYKELRSKDILSVNNIVHLLTEWLGQIGYENLKDDLNHLPETPSYRKSNINEGWEIYELWAYPTVTPYSDSSTYNTGDKVTFLNTTFIATQNGLSGIKPVDETSLYKSYPYVGGMFNSVLRVEKWQTEREKMLDNYLNYNK